MKTYGKVSLVVLIVALLVYLFAPQILMQVDKFSNTVRTSIEEVQAIERIKDLSISIIAFAASLIVFSLFGGVWAIVGGLVLISISLIFIARAFGKKKPTINNINN